MITANTKVVITKGLKARNITKGQKAIVAGVTELERRSVRVVLQFSNGRCLAFYGQHINRLGAPEVKLNTGDPTQKIAFKAV